MSEGCTWTLRMGAPLWDQSVWCFPSHYLSLTLMSSLSTKWFDPTFFQIIHPTGGHFIIVALFFVVAFFFLFFLFFCNVDVWKLNIITNNSMYFSLKPQQQRKYNSIWCLCFTLLFFQARRAAKVWLFIARLGGVVTFFFIEFSLILPGLLFCQWVNSNTQITLSWHGWEYKATEKCVCYITFSPTTVQYKEKQGSYLRSDWERWLEWPCHFQTIEIMAHIVRKHQDNQTS